MTLFNNTFYLEPNAVTSFLANVLPDKGFITMPIKFGDDGEYFAYLADEDVEMPESCECIASFNRWFKIYDDEQVTYTSEHLLGRVGKIYKTPIPYTIIIQTPRKKAND